MAACGPAGPEPLFLDDVVLLPATDPRIRNVATVSVRTGVPAVLDIVADSGDHVVRATEELATMSHAVDIVGLLHDRAYEVTVRAVAIDGRSRSADDVPDLLTPPLPDLFPEFDVVTLDANRVEPGYTLMPVAGFTVASWLVIFDEELRVVWWMSSAESISDARLLPDGRLVYIEGVTGYVTDLMGRTSAVFSCLPDCLAYHHELFPTEHGTYLTLRGSTLQLDAYPTSVEAPEDLAPAEIVTDAVVELDALGNTLREWNLDEILDTTRIGYDSVSTEPGKMHDWAHANAVQSDGDGLMVSLRHQDAVIRLDSDGELDWILGHHAGWADDLAPHLLSPVGEGFEWPWHQHAPMWNSDGHLVLFDNGNHRASPYGGDPDPWMSAWSRVVTYDIDTDTREIREVDSWGADDAGRVWSPAMGDADALPSTGNVLSTWALVTVEDGLPHGTTGHGNDATRLLEVAPDGSVVLDAWLRSDATDQDQGWRSYRAQRLKGLWLPR